jgi:hypothetical protein
MSTALVDRIVNQQGTGPVEFPLGTTISADQPLRIGGPTFLYGNAAGQPGQVIKAGSNSELVWADIDAVNLSAADGPTSGRKLIRITQAGTATPEEVTLEAGSNVTLGRSGDVITISSTFTDTNTVTRLRGETSGTFVSGDLTVDGSGSITVSQTGTTISIAGVDTTYTAGTGVTLSGTEFSIGQAVASTDNVIFNDLGLTGALSVNGGIVFAGTISGGGWDGDTIPINKGGTGATTATAAFQALAPSITNLQDKFLTTDGNNIYWANLPSTGGFTQLTYQLSGQNGPNANSAKVRNTDSDGNFSEITFNAGTDISITRSGDTINIGSTASNTQLTQEQVEDYVGGMIDNTANNGITVTYNDNAGTLEFDVAAVASNDTNTTYDLSSTSITGGAAIQLVPGGDGAGDPTDSVNIFGGTNVTVARDGATGNLTISASDTNTDTVTRLTVTGPGTTGGNNYVSGDISIQASGSISLLQSGNAFAISATDTNSYVDGALWAPLTGALTIQRSDTLSDIVLPVTDLQTYFDNRYVRSANLQDSRITSTSWDSATGTLSLLPNDGSPAITVNLDGRYVTDTGDNFYVTGGSIVASTNNPAGYHTNRKLLQLSRNDGQNLLVELEDLYDYTDTLYAPIGITDTRVSSFTFQSGTLAMSVSNGDNYSFDLDGRYTRADNYVDSASFDTNTGILTLENSADRPSGTGTEQPDVTVDLDGRYRLQSAQDVAIQSLEWNATTGLLFAKKNDGSSTQSESLDGRYIDTVTYGNNEFTFARNTGNNTIIGLPEGEFNFNANNGDLTHYPAGSYSNAPTVTVNLDGRYKLQTEQDVAISALQWNATTGDLLASRNNNTNTSNENLDGRYYRNVTFSGTTFTFTKTASDQTTIQIPESRVDVPNGSIMLFHNSSAPAGWVKKTNSGNWNNRALRVVTGSTVSRGGERGFSTVFTSNVEPGGTANLGTLALSGSPQSGFGSGFEVTRGNLAINGSPSANFTSNFKINRGNLSAAGKTLTINMIPSHAHNYNHITDAQGSEEFGEKDNDGKNVTDATGNKGNGGSHGHNLNGNPQYSGGVTGGKGNLTINGNPQYSGGINTNIGNLAIGGQPGFDSGSIDMNIKYIDVIICTRNDSQ